MGLLHKLFMAFGAPIRTVCAVIYSTYISVKVGDKIKRSIKATFEPQASVKVKSFSFH